jgi:formate-dependent nitrite reductase membrane component NrfD
MNGVPSSTYFTVSPEWGWLITLYFFFGGLAGGAYFLAALIDFCGQPEDRPLARLGYYISFPCIIISGFLLVIDLYRPLRFWHMLIASNTFQPMFKYWSPMSAGSWALLIFGIFAFLSFLGALAESDRLRWSAAGRLHPPGAIAKVLAIVGGLCGFYVAGYTGVLLAVTNRPIWSDTPLLGMLFIASAASTSAALMILLAQRARWTMPGLVALHRMDIYVLGLELIVLIAVVASLGPVWRAWLNLWGLLLGAIIVLGMLFPIVFNWRKDWFGDFHVTATAVLALVGGFLLRIVIVFSSRGI